jgi:hypothetical protein
VLPTIPLSLQGNLYISVSPPHVLAVAPETSFKLAALKDVKPAARLTPPLIARTQGLDLSKHPFDFDTPSAKNEINFRTFPVRQLYFPSKAQMIVHRVD